MLGHAWKFDPSLSSSFAGCLAGIAIGDAMGMPVEMMTRKQIRQKYGRVSGFIDPPTNSHAYHQGLTAGETTDDTQLTEAVAKALVWSKGFDLQQLSFEHISALEQSTIGWGPTTERAVLAMKKRRDGGKPMYKRVPQHFSLENEGCGNGVVMKVAPVALFHILHHGASSEGVSKKLLRDVMRLGALTHSDPRASIGAAAVAEVIRLLFAETPIFSHPAGLLKELDLFVQSAEIDAGVVGKDSLSNQFAKMENMLHDGYPASEVARRLGTASFVVESSMFSIVTALRHLGDFRGGILEAVNAGGDTDSNASVVGAIIGAHCGLEGIPADWLRFRATYLEMAQLGLDLYATFKR